ncbi:MAG: penicillin acylase family protein [Chloroflexota bacterium]|nr:penicillin acylase family protein [Chloroflexota bacterium]
MKVVWVVLVVLVVVVAVVAGLGYAFFYDLTRGPLPRHSGSITVAGLEDEVEVLRDEWGIPHIYAANMHDLLFAQGYTQAQDRWWQMEFFRHTARGAIEELTGKSEGLLATDIFIRTLGWHRVAEEEEQAYDEDTMASLQAFADGVNAYIANRKPGDLALEYSVLRLVGVDIDVEPWTPADTLAFAKIMAWDLGPGVSREVTRASLYQVLGQQMTDQWMTPSWPYGEKPTILQPEDLPITGSLWGAGAAVSDRWTDVDVVVAEGGLPDVSLVFGHGSGIGSNNWVVGGSMTESGMPLLANDPHLGIQMPSIWYQVGLHCNPPAGSDEPTLDVVGFAFSAAPAVIIGHNDSIAWGVTNVGPDVIDLYEIRVNPDNPLQYEWNGQWRDMTLHDETIRFGDGEEPVRIQVRETHLGPIINDNQIDEDTGEVLGFNNEDPLAVRWTALDPGTLCRGIVDLNLATDWGEFREALEYWDVPSQNFVYADVDGNIGYQTPGRIPIRAAGHSGLVPVPGWTDEYEWQGFIPYDSLPRILNPERDYIATANQAVVPPEYYDQLEQELGEGLNCIISQEWNCGYRAERIVELLQQEAPHTVASFQDIQGDDKLISAEGLVCCLSALSFDDAEVADARDWLAEWDCCCHADSPQAALYAQYWASVVTNIYADQLSDEAEAYGDSRDMRATFLLTQEPDNSWWDDIETVDVVETRDDILVRSFEEAYEKMVAAFGSDRSEWKWGSLHTATFVSNPLGQSGVGLIENMVNRGPFAVNGGTSAVNNTVWYTTADGFAVQGLPSMRMIVDLSDLTQSVTVHTTGQSSHPYSGHYDDMIDSWRNIEYYTMLWTRDQVEDAAVDRLVLHP